MATLATIDTPMPQFRTCISNHARFLGWFLHVFTLHAKSENDFQSPNKLPESQLLHAEITDKSKSVLSAICCLIGFESESRRIHHGDLSMLRMFFQISGWYFIILFWTKKFRFLQLIYWKTEWCVEKESRLKVKITPKCFALFDVKINVKKEEKSNLAFLSNH